MISWRHWLRGAEVVEVESGESVLRNVVDDWIELYADKIRRAHRSWEFVGFFIYGRQGAGKTTLALTLAARVLGSWQRALSCLYFDPAEIERVARAAVSRVLTSQDPTAREAVIVWDDAGVWASKYRFRETEYAEAVQSLTELARRITASLIVTATAPRRVLTALREQEWFFFSLVGPFHKGGGKYSCANVYTLSILPTGKVYVSKHGENLCFTLALPDEVRQTYTEMMLRYIERVPASFARAVYEEKNRYYVNRSEKRGKRTRELGEMEFYNEEP